MSTTRHEVADDGLAIFDLRLSSGFRKRIAGYDRRQVELYIRRQEAVMNKIRLEKEQLERQVIRLRQQVFDAREQLAAAREDLASAQSRPPAEPQDDEPSQEVPGDEPSGEDAPDDSDTDESHGSTSEANSMVGAAATTEGEHTSEPGSSAVAADEGSA